MRLRHPRPCTRCGGFALLLLLIFIVLSMLALSSMVTVWTTAVRRERETELLFVGQQYRQAIESYYKSSPGAGQLPSKLEDLLADTRRGVLMRHLRKLYADPMTGEANWALIMVGDRIAGIHSVSTGVPIKVAGLDLVGAEAAAAYQDWKFVYADAVSAAQRIAAATDSGSAPAATGNSAALEPQEPSALTREACDRQRQLDAQECNGVRGIAGITKDDLQGCLGSMDQRLSMCLKGLGAKAPALAVPQIEPQ